MRWIERIVVMAVVPAMSVFVQGCARHHGPQDSTETGNPPVIDATRVALETRGDDVLVIGEKGAVKPGGVTIRVTNLASDKSASGRAASDGSFEIKAPGSATDAYRVQAGSGEEADQVFVLPGVTVRGAAKNGSLSCDQQDELTRIQIDNAVRNADITCTRDDDCTFVSTGTVCRSACSAPVVSNTGAMLVSAVVDSIDQGLCGDFEKQGCMPPVFACPNMPFPAPVPACVSGRCGTKDAGDAGAVDADSDGGDASMCGDRWNMAMAQLQQAVADADKTCTNSADCVYAPSSTDCFGGCDNAIVSTAGKTQVQTALDSINAGVCAGYQADGCPYGEPMCMQAPAPVCKQGQCTGMLDAAMCAQFASSAQAQFDQASASIERACTQNSDCSYAPLPTCVNPNCAITVVSKSSAAQVQALVDQIQNVCSPAEAGGCSYQPSGPVCSPPATQCTQGKCQ